MPTINRIRTLVTGVAGSPWYINMHFVDGDAAQVVAEMNAVKNFFTGVSAALRPDATFTVQGEIARVDVATGNVTGVLAQPPLTAVGAGQGAFLPPANQVVVRLNTGVYSGGRRLRGRIYVPGIVSGSTNGLGQLSTSTIAQFNSSATTLANAGLLVYSKTHGITGAVTGVSTWNQMGVMRSRRD